MTVLQLAQPGSLPQQSASQMIRASNGNMRIDSPETSVITNPLAQQMIVLVHATMEAHVLPLPPGAMPQVAAPGVGFETVSPGELALVRSLFPDLGQDRLLFTPNFAPQSEYAAAFASGVSVTLDNLHPLREWPDILRGHEIFLRVDTGVGAGHHSHVRTAGEASKFGIPLAELDEARALAESLHAPIIGLHAHVGSGILDPDVWSETALALAELSESFPDCRVLDLGGGLGIPERPGDGSLDLARLDRGLRAVKRAYPHLELWLEPGVISWPGPGCCSPG